MSGGGEGDRQGCDALPARRSPTRAVSEQERELAERLVRMAEAMVDNRATNLSTDAIRQLPEQIRQLRCRHDHAAATSLVDAEAACVVELLIALAYARDANNVLRERRMVMFLNSFITFMRQDLQRVSA
jgi:hypothetical protein